MSRPIEDIKNNNFGHDIRLIATDMDGTLTQEGKFTANLIQYLERLSLAGIDVLIVTGRSAGWVEAIANYLPIVGAIAENGGVLYWNRERNSQLLTKIDDVREYRQQLATVFQLLKSKFPRIRESQDNQFRITDWTFDVVDLSFAELADLASICQHEGWGFTYSTVQCHIKPIEQDKATALEKTIEQHYPQIDRDRIITVGDSPNDESLFNPQLFPLSVGVANILEYRDRLKYFPQYITNAPESAGFCELASLIAK